MPFFISTASPIVVFACKAIRRMRGTCTLTRSSPSAFAQTKSDSQNQKTRKAASNKLIATDGREWRDKYDLLVDSALSQLTQSN